MNIRVIRFSAFGDCVLLCPLLGRLKEAGHAVTVITKAAFAPLFAAATGVDRVVAYDPSTGVRGLWSLARTAGDDGVLIDAHNTARSRILSAIMGGAHARIDKFHRERLAHIVFKTNAPVPSMLARYGELSVAAGGEALSLSPGGIAVDAHARERAARDLPHADPGYVAVAPGSRWPMKRWGARRFATLCARIVERGYRIVLLGDGGDRDVTRHITERLGDDCIDVAGKTDMLTAGAHIQRCVAFIGNDSGLMHLAEALGVPVVAVFGPTVSQFGYYPALSRSRTVERSLPCRPCSRNGSVPCPKGTQECLAGIPVAAVDAAFADLVAGVEQRRYLLQ